MKELSETGEQQLGEIINLIECYFALGCYKKVQDYLVDFKRICDMHFNSNNAKRLNGLKGETGQVNLIHVFMLSLIVHSIV